MIRFALSNGEAIHADHPDTFWMPPRRERENRIPGDLVKLFFRIQVNGELSIERMWVIIKARTLNGYVGTLDNNAFCAKEIHEGMELNLRPENIMQTSLDDEYPQPLCMVIHASAIEKLQTQLYIDIAIPDRLLLDIGAAHFQEINVAPKNQKIRRNNHFGCRVF